MRKMTLSGSRAMVNRNRAMAGPKAMKVQPKNTAAVILVSSWGIYSQQRDLKRLVLFLKTVIYRCLSLNVNIHKYPAAVADGLVHSTSTSVSQGLLVTSRRLT